ncbi:MAG: NAD(P)/FAD-dependent oxidoreductase [Prevotella sp.]
MTEEIQLSVSPEIAADSQSLALFIARQKAIDARTIRHIRVLRKSIDARQRRIMVNLSVRVYINEEPTDEAYKSIAYPDVSNRRAVIVIGEGPAGLFASLRLIELGFRPIILERGKDVHERKKDLSLITKTQKVDSESNYSFGEGGAGAYSDGKLYTRSKKRGSVDRILNIFCQHGAPLSILSDAHPHIGTDKLPRVIENMRLQILRSGGEVHFQTRMTRLILQGDKVVGVEAVQQPSGAQLEFRGPVILATGHSARDVYRYLASARIEIEPKGIAVGVRLEHPSHLIDQIMYHNPKGRGQYLPAAEYNMTAQVDGRGVYSFCMCPGGFVVPAATGPKQIVVNGMSPSNRGTKWSNSGMVVETRPEDIPGDDALRVMRFQEELEEKCWEQGNRKQTAPAQRMVDFVEHHSSFDLPKSSYAPGLVTSRLDQWLPDSISRRLGEGFRIFGKRYRGFLTNDAVLIAVETRTSAPVRIVRSPETLQHVRIEGLFPCGEGAGYAGGIVSAGIDGERCAQCAADYLQQ